MKGKIIVSKFWTRFFSAGKAQAITIFPFIFLRELANRTDKVLINHERIHLSQALELLILPFYILYLLEFLFRFVQYRNFLQAYVHISFEREAFENEENLYYIKKRRPFSFLKYLKK